jgi:hypothetical protein
MDSMETTLQHALEYYQREKCSMRKAARQYNVSYATLRKRREGRPTMKQRFADQQLLTPDQEIMLLDRMDYLEDVDSRQPVSEFLELQSEFLAVVHQNSGYSVYEVDIQFSG